MYYFNPFMESYPEMVSLERKRPDDGFNSLYFTPEEAFSKGNLIKSQYDPYRSYQPSMPMGKDEKENLLLLMMVYSGILHDLELLLDVNPEDKTAMNLFKTYKGKYLEVEKTYLEKYAPLCPMHSYEKNGAFAYVKTASPWLKM